MPACSSLVNATYTALIWELVDGVAARRIMRLRSLADPCLFAIAAGRGAEISARPGLSICLCVLDSVYLRPEPPIDEPDAQLMGRVKAGPYHLWKAKKAAQTMKPKATMWFHFRASPR